VQAYLFGLAFSVLFATGILSVRIHTEALEVGYRIEDLRRRAAQIERENECLRVEIEAATTPSALLAPAPPDPVEARLATLMPEWNLLYANGSPGSPRGWR